jgi:hypothetical protein
MNEVVIPLKLSGIAALKAELRSLKDQMADAANPEAFAALADKAGEVQKQINKVNSAINDFKKGSNLDQAKASFDGMSQSIMDMDFTGAAKQSANLKQSLGSLTPGDLTKQFTGFITTLKNLGGAFVKLGMTILVNPIFLIVAAVVAIIAVVALVLKSFGKLDDVMKAMMMPINMLIAGFKELTDWLGLTTFEAEDNAAKTLEANEKIKKSSEEKTARVTADLGREIAELKASGKDTTKLEEERSNVQIKEANKRKQSAKEALDAQKELGDKADKEKIEDLKKQVAKENEIIKQGYSDKVVAKNTADKKESDDADKKEKEASDKAKAARDKRIAADKASEADIAAAAKLVSDSKKTAQQIELDDLAAAYKKKIDEAKKFKNDTTALVEAQGIQEAAINKKYDDAAKANEEASHAANIAKIDAYNAELAVLTDTEEQKLYDKYAADLITFADNELAIFNIKKKYAEDTTALKKTEADKQKIIDDAVVQGQKDIAAAQFDVANNAINLLKSVSGKSKTLQAAVIVADAAMGVSKIISSTAAANAADIAAAALMGPAGAAYLTAKLPLNKINAGLGIASIGIASGKALSALGKGGSTANTQAPDATGGGTSTTAVAPSTPQLFGSANTGSQMNAGGGTGNNITVTAIVSETEITSSQNHINNIQQNSVL